MQNLQEVFQIGACEHGLCSHLIFSVCGPPSGLRLYQKHMALARPSVPAAGIGSFRSLKHRRLAISAIVLSTLCSLAAFVSLVWRDQSQPRVMINEQLAPALKQGKSVVVAKPSPQPPVNSQAAQPKLPEPTSPGMKPFSISTASGLAPLGAVQLRLIRTDPISHVYDLSVVAGGRSFSHRHMKVNEPLWIAGGKGGGAIELIVKLVQTDAITGYWMESNRSAHVSSRRRSARR
ncbi:MAG: hypothetical protein JO210_01720 [Acidobacteriaceae bacterium]|nr:hypothetical protein [Acidobacteriaceae bacterium]